LRILVALAFVSIVEISSAEIPDIFVDKGACPGEGCTYCGLYRASQSFDLLREPSTSSEVVGKVLAEETFISKTGEVHTVPTRFEVHEASGPFLPGDDVFALTYGGEGWFRVFHNGELIDADLGFSPWGGGAGKTCDKPEFCFGQLTKDLEFTWWIFVVSESGAQGWTAHDNSMKWIDGDPWF